MYTLYKFHFLNGISEINQLFDDILIIWPAPVYTEVGRVPKNCTQVKVKVLLEIFTQKKIKKIKNNVMYCQVWWPILEIGPLHLTHPSAHTQQWVVNTHTVNTHLEQWAAIAPAPREQLGVWCLAQGHLSHGIEGGESAVHSQVKVIVWIVTWVRVKKYRIKKLLK